LGQRRPFELPAFMTCRLECKWAGTLVRSNGFMMWHPHAMPTPLELARALVDARRQGHSLDESEWEAAVAATPDAYAVQEAVLDALDGQPALAWKSGGPSRESPLTHAPLPRAGLLRSGATLAPLPSGRRIVEAEIALKLGRDVTAQEAGQCTHETAAEWVSGFAPAIEVVDSRWAKGLDCGPLLKLADHQGHGALVLGEFVPYRPVDWTAQECSVTLGDTTQTFVGTHALRHPAWLLPIWLRHATRNGATIPAGTVVTTGTWCGLLPVPAGTRVRVAFPGIGDVSVRLD